MGDDFGDACLSGSNVNFVVDPLPSVGPLILPRALVTPPLPIACGSGFGGRRDRRIGATDTFPPGYITGTENQNPNSPETSPGWGWGSLLLNNPKQSAAYGATNFSLPITVPASVTVRTVSLSVFLCSRQLHKSVIIQPAATCVMPFGLCRFLQGRHEQGFFIHHSSSVPAGALDRNALKLLLTTLIKDFILGR